MKALEDFVSTVLFVERRLDQDYERAAVTRDAALEALTTKRMRALCAVVGQTDAELGAMMATDEAGERDGKRLYPKRG